MNLPPPPVGSNGGVTDLLTETDTRVSLLSYLRSVYPKDWANFLERLTTDSKVTLPENPQDLTGEEFMEGGIMFEHQTELLLWASHRGQLLSRTVSSSKFQSQMFCLRNDFLKHTSH